MDLGDWIGISFICLIVWHFGALYGHDKGFQAGRCEAERVAEEANRRKRDEHQSPHQEPS